METQVTQAAAAGDPPPHRHLKEHSLSPFPVFSCSHLVIIESAVIPAGPISALQTSSPHKLLSEIRGHICIDHSRNKRRRICNGVTFREARALQALLQTRLFKIKTHLPFGSRLNFASAELHGGRHALQDSNEQRGSFRNLNFCEY